MDIKWMSDSKIKFVVDRLIEEKALVLRVTVFKTRLKELGWNRESRLFIYNIRDSKDDRNTKYYLIEWKDIFDKSRHKKWITAKQLRDIFKKYYKNIEIIDTSVKKTNKPTGDLKVSSEIKDNTLSQEDLNSLFEIQTESEVDSSNLDKKVDIKEVILPQQQDKITEEIKTAILSSEQVKRGFVREKTPGSGCEKCNYTGWIKDASTGIETKCDCQLIAKRTPKLKKSNKPKVNIENQNLLRNIIPLERRKDEYSLEIALERIRKICNSQNCKVAKYDTYTETLNTILGQIITSKLKNSYIIGAPNGFGKSTFVYTALKRLLAQNKKVVPYLSLVELAEKKVEYETRLLEKLKNPRFSKPLRREPDEFIWKDFIEADVLFTFMSAVGSKEIESMILSAIMTLRASKNRPTVVMMSTSIEPYIYDDKLRKYYWDDMFTYSNKEEEVGVDRLIHRSCYRQYNTSMPIRKGIDY